MAVKRKRKLWDRWKKNERTERAIVTDAAKFCEVPVRDNVSQKYSLKKTQNWAVYIVVAYMLVYLNRDES